MADLALAEGGFKQRGSLFFLYPDSFVKNIFLSDKDEKAQVSYNTWISAGMGFDPADDTWSDPNLSEAWNREYYLDSMLLRYGYFRTNEDSTIVDTLIVQVFKSMDSMLLNGKHSADGGLFAVPKIHRKTGRGAKFFYELKILLTAEDSTVVRTDGTFSLKTMSTSLTNNDVFRLGIEEKAHVTVSFKPGQSYAPGDKVYYDRDLVDVGGKMPNKRLNSFGILVGTQSPIVSPLKSHNNGSFVTKWNRYADTTHDPGFTKGYYHPERFSSKGVSLAYYPHIGFYVGAAYTKVDKQEWNVGVKVYPNPCSHLLVLEYSPTKGAHISYAIKDLTGRTLQSELLSGQAQVRHRHKIDLDQLKPGMYILNFRAGNKMATHRIVKQ